MPEDFAIRLKSLMRQKRVTLKQVADATGKSISAVQKWTTGGDITYDALRKLADFMEVNWIWLRYGEEALSGLAPESSENSMISRMRRQFIAEIQEREALLMMALNNVRMAVWQCDLINDAFKIVNDEELFGTHLTHFGDIERIILPEDRPARDAAIEQALRNHALYICDFRIRHPGSGQIRWIRVRGKPLQDPAGRPVKLAGVAYDITEMKDAEQASEMAQRRLEEAMAAANVTAWEVDLQTGNAWHSDNKARICGINSLRINTLDEFIRHVHPDDVAAVQAALQHAITNRLPIQTRYRIIDDYGQANLIEAEGNVIYDDVKAVRLIGISRRIQQ